MNFSIFKLLTISLLSCFVCFHSSIASVTIHQMMSQPRSLPWILALKKSQTKILQLLYRLTIAL